jgi:hypothetical protein
MNTGTMQLQSQCEQRTGMRTWYNDLDPAQRLWRPDDLRGPEEWERVQCGR